MSIKKELINNIELFADLLEFNDANKFKVNAFRNGANIIRRIDEDIELLVESGEINNIKGIGKGISAFISEFFESGQVTELEELREDISDELLELFGVKGLGARKIRVLRDDLDIQNLDDLEAACLNNKIAELKGFGLKSQEKIMKEIARIQAAEKRLLINKAEFIAENILEKLKQIDSVISAEPTGELRRGMEIIDRIEILCRVTDKEEFLINIGKIFAYNEIASVTLSKISIDIDVFPEVFIYLSTEDTYADYLLRTTGSSEFLLLGFESEIVTDSGTEEEIFKLNNKKFIIPEMREEEYFKADSELRENSDLELSAFNGFFHFHTTYSDGMASLREMVKGAEKLGFGYFAVCDHSKSAFYANGLEERRVLQQTEEIRKTEKELGLPIFQGIESDILGDGSLDYSADFLVNFDLVVASVHSLFNLSEEEMTARIIKAVENPFTDILAHPTGRLLLSRDAYKINIKKVIDACSRNDVAIELNSNPHRLDLDWRHIYYAREQGCRFSINPDSHSVESINEIRYGIKLARKGGMRTGEVINCFSLDEFKQFINRKVKRGAE
jgi:DNA polymerase (family 10)